MRIKANVQMRCLTPQCLIALGVASWLWYEMFPEHPLVITCISDGEHGTGSAHYEGNAFDTRRRDPEGAWSLTAQQADAFAKELRARLPVGEYDVVVHDSHIHTEYDPKGPAK